MQVPSNAKLQKCPRILKLREPSRIFNLACNLLDLPWHFVFVFLIFNFCFNFLFLRLFWFSSFFFWILYKYIYQIGSEKLGVYRLLFVRRHCVMHNKDKKTSRFAFHFYFWQNTNITNIINLDAYMQTND